MADAEEPMAVDGGHRDSGCDWDGRWNHVKKFLERPGPFTHPDFEPSTESLQFLLETCKILVIGAGGLGCELLKNLALSGFRLIHVVDMDTIDVSNLNRQFLFRAKDVGRPKADVAADFINSRISGCKVVPHFKKIQDFDDSFYRQFHIIVCGLDSIVARRWINGMLISLLSYEDGVLDPSSIIPLIDGGTEGFKGNARVILPGMTACIDCTLELYPPQVINFPMCTIASMPRLPEHCIEYARILQWPKEKPFGGFLDGDNPDHIRWVFERSQERAAEFSITGVTYRLTQGVVKRIIPAVASTNAVIAGMKLEFLKPLCVPVLGIPLVNLLNQTSILLFFVDFLSFIFLLSRQMKSPAITTTLEGKNKTLYLQSVKSIEERTRPNLCKTLKELGLSDGQEIAVADVTTPQTVLFKLNFTA
uniref:NEDD8-activating enzyme E1 catalytic subunit n=1 Tax=Fundulus heteroclitus TaxID=8078 RepID=A0A3Q2QCW7_FUNHE